MSLHIKSYGQGMPVVFFHGWGFDNQIWLPLVALLEHRYQLILVDLPGFGKTPLMDWETFKTDLLDSLPASFALVGWSLGGLYAMRLASETSMRITRLFNVAASPNFIANDAWPGISKVNFRRFYNNLLTDPDSMLRDFIALQSMGSTSLVEIVSQPRSESLTHNLKILESWDLRDALRTLKLPTYFLFGRLDSIVPASTMHVMQNIYPHFTYGLIKKAAHIPFLSHADLFIDALTDFIE